MTKPMSVSAPKGVQTGRARFTACLGFVMAACLVHGAARAAVSTSAAAQASMASAGGVQVSTGSADLQVAKTVDRPTPNEGESVTYSVTVKNNGPDAASNVNLTDLLPAGLAYVSSTPSQGTYVSGTGVWTVGSVANGDS